MLHSWKTLAAGLGGPPERVNHIVGALEFPIKHARIIGIHTQFLAQQTL